MPDHSPGIAVSRPTLDAAGLASLGARWRGLEAASDTSVFQTWTWVGCNAAERFPDPLLIEAQDGEGLVALALCNRRRSAFGDTVWLHESGDAAQDAVFTEHNDPLLARCAPGETLTGLLLAALQPFNGRVSRLMLSGVGEATRAAAMRTGAMAVPERDRIAPYMDFAGIAPDASIIDQLSANTRQQLRRSDRAYAARGELRLEVAQTAEQATQFLDALLALHVATWSARGRPSAFATGPVQKFHQCLIRRGVPGAAELLRITAGGSVVGYLYNLVHAGQACAYQSGFDYPAAPAHGKPGLTCHHLAMAAHRAQGGLSYDFLGGADRYKRSLANAERTLHWLSIAPRRHPMALLARLRRLAGR